MTNLDPKPGARRPREHAPRPISDRHHVAVVQAEASRLAQALQPFGVLRKDQLKLIARAATWHEGSFDNALTAAVESGHIERLPFGFYRKAGPQGGQTRGA